MSTVIAVKKNKKQQNRFKNNKKKTQRKNMFLHLYNHVYVRRRAWLCCRLTYMYVRVCL